MSCRWLVSSRGDSLVRICIPPLPELVKREFGPPEPPEPPEWLQGPGIPRELGRDLSTIATIVSAAEAGFSPAMRAALAPALSALVETVQARMPEGLRFDAAMRG